MVTEILEPQIKLHIKRQKTEYERQSPLEIGIKSLT